MLVIKYSDSLTCFSSQPSLRGIFGNREWRKYRKYHVLVMHTGNTWSSDTAQNVHGGSGTETLGSAANFNGQKTRQVSETFICYEFSFCWKEFCLKKN